MPQFPGAGTMRRLVVIAAALTGLGVSTTELVGGGQSVSRCLYTFLTAWSPPRNGWIVTGIRQPSFDCAIGGIDAS